MSAHIDAAALVGAYLRGDVRAMAQVATDCDPDALIGVLVEHLAGAIRSDRATPDAWFAAQAAKAVTS